MKFSMLNISALYLINGSLLGQATFQADFTPHCLAYFCQTCGEIWARVIITGGEATPHWTFETAPCEKHLCSGVTDWKHYPGCLCIESTCTKERLSVMLWGRALEHLPAAVLKRELDLTINLHDRIHSAQEPSVTLYYTS